MIKYPQIMGLCKQIVQAFHPNRIILFGSYEPIPKI